MTKRLCQLRIWGKIKILAEIIFIDLNTRQNFLIYEKFQLHRFYRKLADFAAGGLQGEGGLTKHHNVSRNEKGEGGGWVKNWNLNSDLWFDINSEFEHCSFWPHRRRSNRFPNCWITRSVSPSPRFFPVSAVRTKWLINEHNQISQYVPMQRVSLQLNFDFLPRLFGNKKKYLTL